jgi:hypothetical protein
VLITKSIFEQEWFYDAATDGNWKTVSYRGNGIADATLIFSTYRRRGASILSMPPLSRVMQPSISFESPDVKDEQTLNIKAIQGLLEALPQHDEFTYSLPPDTSLDLAFRLGGCTVATNYTFRADQDALKTVWSSMHQKVRYNIRLGLKKLSVDKHDDVGRYIALSRSFIRGRAFKDIVNYNAIERIWHACRARNQSTILTCIDQSGKDVASAIVIWDDTVLYYWINCRNSSINDYYANTVLIWTAMEIAKSMNLTFDADGFATTNAGSFFSRIGLAPHRRFDVVRANSKIQLKDAFAKRIKDLVGVQLKTKLLSTRNLALKNKTYSVIRT